jgi:hypothetical protein
MEELSGESCGGLTPCGSSVLASEPLGDHLTLQVRVAVAPEDHLDRGQSLA